ncbi:MAG: hypothetical protein ACOY3J_04240 [Bacillota bacterium]
METNMTSREELIAPQPTNSSKKRNILIAVLLAVFLFAGSAYGYFVHDLFKSPKQIYLEAEGKHLSQLVKTWGESYDWYYKEYVKPYLENPVRSTVEISAGIKGLELPDPNLWILLDILEKSKIIAESFVDEKNQQYYTKFDVALEGNKLIGFETFVDKTKFGFGVPLIYNKYAVVDLKDRDKLKEKFGVTALPKKILTYNDVLDAFRIPKEEREALFEDYAKLYVDSLKKTQVTMQKGTFPEGNMKINTRILTISFTEAEIADLMKKMADKMAEDEKLLNLVYTKQKSIIKLMDDAGYDLAALGIKEKEKSEIKGMLQEFSKNIHDGLKDLKLADGVKMVLYIDGKDNILEREVTFGNANDKTVIKTARWVDASKQENGLFVVSGGEQGKSGELKAAYTKKPIDSKTKKGTFSFSLKDDKEDFSLLLESDFSEVKDGAKQDDEVKFTVTAKDQEGTGKFSGELKTNMAVNEKDKNREMDSTLKLTFDVSSEGIQGANLNVTVKQKDEFGAEVKLPKLEAGNTVDVVNISEEEMFKLQQELMAAVQQFVEKNMALFQPYMQ